MKPFLTIQTRLWAEWAEGSKQTKLGRTRSSPEESVPEAIRPSRRTFHLFSWFILFQKLHNQAILILFFKVKNEAERDKKEAAEQEKLFQLERCGQKMLLFYLPTEEINCQLSSPISSTDFIRRYSSWKGSTIHILMIFFVISNKPFL